MTAADERAKALEWLRPYVERARSFTGWDLSQIPVRLVEPGPPWDYEHLVREYGQKARSALDMGTGGGEALAELRDALPARLIATEEWAVNAPVARRRLAPLGVEVVHCSDLRLPFADASFDLVINRHEWLDPADVARVLRPGGHVITQQVGANNWRELRRHFPRRTDFGDIYGDYMRGFAAAGLHVSGRRHDYRAAYPSLGDVVYMLAIAPWEIPDFDLERDLDALLALEADCRTEDGIVLTESRFLIMGEKPA
jgi:SAM-dependent methyltransferase